MIIAFDLDDTLCFRPKGLEHLGKDKYAYCEPIYENIEICNKFYDDGHTIIIYTARGMETFKGDVAKIYNNLFEETKSFLKKWNIKHHQLVMGKIHYDYLIDDKAYNIKDIASLIIKK